MTKLQSIVAEIEALPVDEQREVVSQFAHLVSPDQGEYIFSDEEWAEIEDRMKNDTQTFTLEEVMTALRNKHASDTVIK